MDEERSKSPWWVAAVITLLVLGYGLIRPMGLRSVAATPAPVLIA